jgi:hypothetical protein
MANSTHLAREVQETKQRLMRNRIFFVATFVWFGGWPFFFFYLTNAFALNTTPYPFPIAILLIFFIAWFGGSFFLVSRPKHISSEERMLIKLDSAFFMLDKYKTSHNDVFLKDATKNVYSAGDKGFFYSTFFDDIESKLRRALNAIAFLIKRNEGNDIDTARELLNELESFLMNPNMTAVKAFIDQTEALKEAPEPSPRFRFVTLRQNFLVQASISIIASLLIVPGVTFVLGVIYAFDSANVVRANPLIFIGAVVASFVGILAAFRVKQ